MRLLWDFVIGPVLALLPKEWRQALADERQVDWTRAAMVSGICEMLLAVVGIGFWYLYQMGWGIEHFLLSSSAPGLTEHQVTGAALLLYYLSPLTWLLFYFFFEGAVRLLGGFTENVLGSFPLWLLSRPLYWGRPRDPRSGPTARENARSFAESLREKMLEVRGRKLPDEVAESVEDGQEFLEIRASRKKGEWVAPKVVRIGEKYYRLEESWVIREERPFRYRLRRLEAGVPGRTVIVYER